MSELSSAIARLRELLKSHADALPSDVRVSYQEIERIQRRLGTPEELPDDGTRVRALVHDLSNICTRFTLRGSF